MDKCQHDYDPDGNYCVRCYFAPTRAVMASEMIAFQQRIKALEKWLRDIFTAYHQFETDGFTEVLMNVYNEFVNEE